MFAWVKLLVAPVSTWLQARAKRAEIKEERKTRVAEAEAQALVARASMDMKNEGDYDTEAQRQMQHSWKDEYLVIVLTSPFIGSFIPTVQDHVAKGWEFVALAPPWYQWSFVGVICATFGLRWYARKTAIPK